MGTAEEANTQPHGEADDEAPPSYPFAQAEPPAYDAGEGPAERPLWVSSMLLPLSPVDDVDTGGTVRFAPDDVLPPVVLVLDGQAIYSANASSDARANSSTAIAHPHLYEVNRGITSRTAATYTVEFARMEPRSKTPVPRSRHIYNLHHPPPTVMRTSNSAVPYDGCFIEPAAAPTRKRGPLGLKRRGIARVGSVSTALVDHWTVLPVDLHGWAELGHPPFVADAAALWDVRQVSGGAVKWVDGACKDVAMEFDGGDEVPAVAVADKGKNELPRLIVTASLRREDLDALVALWCCRVWEKSIHAHRGKAVKTRLLPSVMQA
ncbi:hypothetical protein SCUCBS95973_004740 [Sporothrix curviconia]|uniref:Uncharacterized protein n=1 Tax=Sporothrix curviconia TaxID=1260050 RepID=A0ABP0BSU0_9PEZI